MNKVFIGIGSNLGDKERNIKTAISLLKEKCKILKLSPLYETEPVGFKDQDWFLNCVVEIGTELDPGELLEFMQNIEKKLKKIKTIENGPRTIDLDILFYNDAVINEKNLVIPHPGLHQRLFVLVPLNDIAPELIHPVLKKTIRNVLRELKSDDKVVLK